MKLMYVSVNVVYEPIYDLALTHRLCKMGGDGTECQMERVKTAFNFRIFIEIGGKLFM
jgi:hypothetical protein